MKIWKIESAWSTEYVSALTIQSAIKKYDQHVKKEVKDELGNGKNNIAVCSRKIELIGNLME